MAQTVHYLKDYQAPDFKILQTDLRFDVADPHTTVHARLLIAPQQNGAPRGVRYPSAAGAGSSGRHRSPPNGATTRQAAVSSP